VFPIDLPPLRERAEDIPLLARYLADRLAQRHGVEPLRLDEKALAYLAGRPWPGNVRELSNLLERATIVEPGSLWTAENLRRLAGDGAAQGDEAEALRQALLDAGGDKHMAAERLGISYRTLQRRIKKHDLEGFPKYRD
jgi:DNA-binding NtrC family response regulator